MAGEAARLGILPDGLGIGDLGASQNARAAAYARAGVSPRFGPIQPDLTASYGLGSTGYNTIQDLGLDDLGRLDGYSRSRRGSLSRPDGFDLDGGHLDPGYDAPIGSRLRRDSLPFQY